MIKMISIKRKCNYVFYNIVNVFNEAAVPLIIGFVVISFIMLSGKYKIRLIELNMELHQMKQEISKLEDINRKTNAEVCYLRESLIK